MAWRHCEQIKVVALEVEVWSWLAGRMVVVELDIVAAVRRREVCIAIVYGGFARSHDGLAQYVSRQTS